MSGVEEVRELIHALYELDGCSCGGPLHIVTDDGNIEDCHIRWCIDELDGWMEQWYEGTQPKAVRLVALAVAYGLLGLDETGREIATGQR